MNGARTFLMRKGYLLTALAAAVLLAASPGIASAQVTATLDKELAEGALTDISVEVKISVPEGGAGGAITITATEAAVDATGTTHEDNDVVLGSPALRLTYLPGPADDGDATTSLTSTAILSGTIPVQAVQGDDDAEDEVTSIDLEVTLTGSATAQVDVAENNGGGDGNLDALDSATVAIPALPLTIKDDETQTYTLALAAGEAGVENGIVKLDLKAVPPHDDNATTLTLQLSDPVNYKWDDDDITTDNNVDPPANIRIGATTATPAGIGNEEELWIQAPPNDKNRETDTITLTAYSGTAGNAMEVASVDVAFADLHTLAGGDAVTAMVVDMAGMEVMDPTITEGGDAVDLVISVDRGTGRTATTTEKLTVTVEAADPGQASDYRLSPAMVELPMVQAADGVQTAMTKLALSAVLDDDVVEDEVLMLNLVLTGDSMANGEGSSTGMFEVTIVDATETQIAPKATDVAYPAITEAIAAGAGDDGKLNPGEMVEIMTSDLFDVMDGYSASYGVSVSSDAVSASASGSMVTINALKAGPAEVTITGSASMSSGLKPSQTVSNVASLTFPVNVVDKALMITLEMPDNVMDGNIVEGMPYEIGVMANRMVTEAEGSVEVAIMADRSASDARAGEDYTVGNATIMAGYDSATATLDVLEDNMPDAGTNDNMGEVLVLYGEYGDGMQTNDLMLTIWDKAVPALPLIAQILLALFLALGGARLHRRRQG